LAGYVELVEVAEVLFFNKRNIRLNKEPILEDKTEEAKWQGMKQTNNSTNHHLSINQHQMTFLKK
jgi:hypothetical protein